MLPEKVIDQIDRTDTEDLLCELGDRGDRGFADTIEVAVDAGMDSRHGNGEGDDAQQRCSAALQKEGYGNGIGVQIDTQRAASGQSHSHQETGQERAERSMIVMRACFAGDVFRDSRLKAGYCQGERECEYRRDQLVNAHALSAESVREENTVKETDKAAEQSGQRQNNSSGYKGIFPVPFHNTPSL